MFGIAFLLAGFCRTVHCQEHAIIPEPLQVSDNNAIFNFSEETTIEASVPLLFEARYFLNILQSEFGIKSIISSGDSDEPKIKLILDKTVPAKEQYRLRVSNDSIVITGSTPAGVFYGIQTLRQWMWKHYNAERMTLKGVFIDDEPRYSFRALMLDPARHFLPLDGLKSYIDVMSQYKFNRLHLHLSDDQGWRIEIKGYPKLTEIGSVRQETDGDGKPHGGFYSQDEMKELVAYAADRQVTIIPEIDVPGHSVAAIAAYPYLTCFEDEKLNVRTTPGVSKDLLCAGNDSVFVFLDNVITELSAIFPGEEFHIGGDEAPLDHWKTCPKCKKRMETLNIDNPRQLMSFFFEQVNKSLLKNRKRPLIWYELDVPYYPENSTMYAWRQGLSRKVVRQAGRKGYELIMSPGEHAYFDYPQAKGEETCDWMPVLSLKQAYQFDPCMGLNPSTCGHIIGVEATVWGEYVQDIDRAFYMTWPRGFALSEAGWSSPEKRDWNTFKKKLKIHFVILKKQGVNFRQPVE